MLHDSSHHVPLSAIAAAANVSRMTVSLALRNSPSLPASTRHRIQDLARRMGYRPDPDIAHLMERIREKRRHVQRNTIAYLTAYEGHFTWKDHPTQLMYYSGAKQRAQEYGYVLEEFWLRETGMTERRLSEIIRNRGIEGLIVAPLPSTAPLYKDFNWEYFSAVELGYSLAKPALHRACNHQFQSMMTLIKELAHRGYRRFGLAVHIEQDERVNYHWRGAFAAGSSLWGAQPSVPPLLASKWTIDVFDQWLQDHGPDVIITVSAEVHDWLERLGRKIPEDVALANVDLRPTMAGTTGIDQNSVLVGATAVDLLISLVRHGERGIPNVPKIIMVEGRFVSGKTAPRVERKSLGRRGTKRR